MQFNEICYKYFKYAKASISVLFWLLLIFAFESPREGCMTIIAAVIHESGHVLYTLLRLKRPSAPYGALSGLRIKRVGILSYGEEISLYLSGPLANLIGAILVTPLIGLTPDFAKDFAVINLLTMVSNLLPIEGYAGYGAISAIAEAIGKGEILSVILQRLSFCFTVLMMLISLYLMYYLNGGYWIYAIFMLSALSFIKKSLKSQKRRF